VSDIKLKLSSSTKSELLSLQSETRRRTWRRSAFVLVSKEINALENEMLGLKDSLAERKSMPSLLHVEESTLAAGNYA